MIKNIKLAIGLGVGLWAIIVVVISVAMFIPGIRDGIAIWIVDWIAVGIAAYFLSKIYFKKTPGNIIDGSILAVFWLAVGVILDLIVTVPLFIRSQVSEEFGRAITYAESAGYFFYQWQLWISFIILIAVVAFVSKNVISTNTDIPNAFPDSQ